MTRLSALGAVPMPAPARADDFAPAPRAQPRRPLDAMENGPSMPDGVAFVKAQLADIRARVAKGQQVRVVFDIDDTLADTKPRTVAIAKQWDKLNGTHYFDRLTPAQVARSPLDTARAMELSWQAERDFTNYWGMAFWDGANYQHDAPMKGPLEVARAARAAGAEVIFLTGRTEQTRDFTIAQLKAFGLDGVDQHTVVSKPQRWMRTPEFKTAWFERSAAQGYHTAFFMTESRRDISYAQSGADVPSVLLESKGFNGNEPIRPDTPLFPSR
jgi:phosphoglycolate phosphatase-like HAD superfamily hydrolase